MSVKSRRHVGSVSVLILVAAAAVLAQPIRAQQNCCVQGYRAGEALVWFVHNTSSETVDAIALAAGARVLQFWGVSPTGPLYQMSTPIAEEASVIARFQSHAEVDHAQPIFAGCAIGSPVCECCPCGFFCPFLPPCSGDCAGATPDGDYIPGLPLTIEPVAGGDIRLNWGASCDASDNDYSIYQGPLGSFTQHVPVACTTQSATTMTLTPAPGSVYYLVVPASSLGEGSYGVDSLKLQRPASVSRCRPAALAVGGGCSVICGDGFRRGDEACDNNDFGANTCPSVGFDGGELACSESCALITTGCTSVCGDGIRRGLEECDGSDLGGDTCTSIGFDTGTLGCDGPCAFDTSACTSVCGDGIRKGNEVCDGADFGSSSCVGEGFDSGTLTCDASCDSFTTENCAQCGDGVRHPNEQCDGTDLGGQTCANFGFTGGTLACRPECQFSLASCTICGNNAREGSEICDGTDLAGQTCATQGFTGGSLGCNASCSDFNRSACTRCGNGVREAGEVCDGADLGGRSCESLGYSGGTLTCSASCLALNTSLCFN